MTELVLKVFWELVIPKLKYVSKICGLNFETVVTIRDVSDFSHSDGVLKLWLIPTGLKKLEAFSQGTDDSKNLRCETLYISDYE